MWRAGLWQALAAYVALAAGTGAATGAGTAALAQPSLQTPDQTFTPALSGCQTAKGGVYFDFEGASRSACYIEDESTLSILVTPEHVPPINPSPWYAFRYSAADDAKLTVNVRYIGARHRYAPKWQGQGNQGQGNEGPGNAAALSFAEAEDGSSISIILPSGNGFVSGQPLLTAPYYDALLGQLAVVGGGQRITLGRSYDRRAIEAVRLGNADAPHLVLLLGRQHPPEVTGAMAMDAFALKVARLIRSGNIDPAQFQFLIVPLMNPDGVARGHWRGNLGGVDLNRDWGLFKQPETRAVRDWLAKLPGGIKPVLMLDFHSTDRNLFYVQGEEATAEGKAFLTAWLGGKEKALEGYPFAIEPRNANPGSGTTKNWFNAAYGISAYTYEVGDESDPLAARSAAEMLAETMIPSLILALDGKSQE